MRDKKEEREGGRKGNKDRKKVREGERREILKGRG